MDRVGPLERTFACEGYHTSGLPLQQEFDSLEQNLEEIFKGWDGGEKLPKELQEVVLLNGIWEAKSSRGTPLLHLLIEVSAERYAPSTSLFWNQLPADQLNWNVENQAGETPLHFLGKRLETLLSTVFVNGRCVPSWEPILNALGKASKHSVNPFALNHEGLTALQQFCRCRDRDVASLIRSYLQIIEARGEPLQTLLEDTGSHTLSPLGLALSEQSVVGAGELLLSGVDPFHLGQEPVFDEDEARLKPGRRCLWEVWKEDLEAGGVDRQEVEGFFDVARNHSPLRGRFGLESYPEILETYIDQMDSSFLQEPWEESHFWKELAAIAVESGGVEALKKLQKKEIDLQKFDPDQKVQLLLKAIEAEQWEVCRFLTEQGMDLSKVEKWRYAFERRIMKGCPDSGSLERLISFGGGASVTFGIVKEVLLELDKRGFPLSRFSILDPKEEWKPSHLTFLPTEQDALLAMEKEMDGQLLRESVRVIMLLKSAISGGNRTSFLWLIQKLHLVRHRKSAQGFSLISP